MQYNVRNNPETIEFKDGDKIWTLRRLTNRYYDAVLVEYMQVYNTLNLDSKKFLSFLLKNQYYEPV